MGRVGDILILNVLFIITSIPVATMGMSLSAMYRVTLRMERKECIYIVKEYSFGVCADDTEIIISDEHKIFKWVDYSEATKLLKWDSNKNALWELNERLIKNGY